MASRFNMLSIGCILSINYVYIVGFAFMGVTLVRRCAVGLPPDGTPMGRD
jgi:hypothetical protein